MQHMKVEQLYDMGVCVDYDDVYGCDLDVYELAESWSAAEMLVSGCDIIVLAVTGWNP